MGRTKFEDGQHNKQPTNNKQQVTTNTTHETRNEKKQTSKQAAKQKTHKHKHTHERANKQTHNHKPPATAATTTTRTRPTPTQHQQPSISNHKHSTTTNNNNQQQPTGTNNNQNQPPTTNQPTNTVLRALENLGIMSRALRMAVGGGSHRVLQRFHGVFRSSSIWTLSPDSQRIFVSLRLPTVWSSRARWCRSRREFSPPCDTARVVYMRNHS